MTINGHFSIKSIHCLFAYNTVVSLTRFMLWTPTIAYKEVVVYMHFLACLYQYCLIRNNVLCNID